MHGSITLIWIDQSAFDRACRNRGPEYRDAVLKVARIENGKIGLTKNDWASLRLRFSPPGLGDQVARAAKPIAATLDQLFSTQFSNCSGCKNRQAVLNEWFPRRD